MSTLFPYSCHFDCREAMSKSTVPALFLGSSLALTRSETSKLYGVLLVKSLHPAMPVPFVFERAVCYEHPPLSAGTSRGNGCGHLSGNTRTGRNLGQTVLLWLVVRAGFQVACSGVTLPTHLAI